MRQRQQAHSQQLLASQKIRYFLSTFKTTFCQNPYPHHIQFCHEYHSEDDRRRPPYLNEGFPYRPSEVCPCNQLLCPLCHNIYELFYHPLFYKTTKCNNYHCNLGDFCYLAHEGQLELLQRYQFFRFQLETFKTELCPHRQQPSNMHELASCHFYHNESDRRRNPKKVGYSHVQCSKSDCSDPVCPFAHNKIQQLYHPSRYKTKYCQSYIHKKSCQYNEYCSFAHSDAQIKIELLHQIEKDQAFYDYKYKTVWCPYTNQHDRGHCSYAHNFQDYRRDPKKKHYTPQICINWTKGEIKSIEDSGCPLRMECPKSHGWLEKKFHPDLKKWEAGETEKKEADQTKREQKPQNQGQFVLGAPFFQPNDKDDKGQKGNKNPSGTKCPEKPVKKEKAKDKWFNFSIFLPEQETLSVQNNQNEASKVELEAYWQTNTTKEFKGNAPSSPLPKSRIVKKHKTEYTQSLKQLLVKAGLEDKLSGIKINQIKLLSLSPEEVDKLGLNVEQRQLLDKAIKDYSKTHRLDKVNYTDSMVKIFRKKLLLQTLQKLRKKGVSQSILQHLSSSSIEDLSFLEEEEKSSLPKILQQYEDDRAFRELNVLIERQAYIKVRKQKQTPFYSSFKE